MKNYSGANLFRGAAATVAGRFRAGRTTGRSTRTAHGSANATLLFRRELQNVVDQKVRVILIIALERSGRRSGENPVAVIALEEARRHGRARSDGLRVEHPTFHPIGLQATAGLEEVGSSREASVGRISGGVALQARSGCAAEEAARHFGFLGGQDGNLFRNVREGLARKSLEESNQLSKLVFGERKRWHADLEVGAHAVAIGVRGAERRILQEPLQPLGIDARAFCEQLGRQLLLYILVTSHSHQRSFLAGDELVAAHAVIFFDHPPAFLDVAAIIERAVLIVGRKRIFLAAQKESGERPNLVLGEVQIRHSQLFCFGLVLALVPDVGLGEFVFEETLLVVPGLLGRTFRQARKIVWIRNWLDAAALGNFREQCEIQTLDWLAALDGQLGADAAFFLEAGNFMATGAAEMANPLLAFVFQIWIVHEGGIRVRGRLLLFQCDEIAGNIFRVLRRQTQARHHGHVLDLELVAVIGAAAVLEVENVGQAFLFVILGTDVLLFEGAIGARALARVVDPTNQVIVIGLLADATEIGRESSALQLIAFADGVAGEAAARFEQFFSVRGVARLVLGQVILERGLPTEGGDGLDLVVVQTEIRHFRGGTEIARLLEPHGNPILVELEADVLEIWSDLFHVLEETLGGTIELHDAQVELAVGDFESDGAIVEAVGFLVALGFVGLLHQVAGLLEVVLLLLIELLDLLGDGEQILGFLVVAFETVTADAATLAEKILAFADHPPNVIGDDDHVGGVANLAARFVILRCENGPEPMFIVAMSFFSAGGGAPVALMARGTAELVRIVNLQEIGFRVAGEGPRILIRLFAW